MTEDKAALTRIRRALGSGTRGPAPPPRAALRQFPFSNRTVIVRSGAAPAQLIAAARREVLTVDPNQPIYNVRTLEQVRSNPLAPWRLNLTLLGLFAALALTLAAVGNYGVVSYGVTQRTREIGVRLALGARPRDILRMVVWYGLRLVLVGAVVGVWASFALTRFLESLLFGVGPTDAMTFTEVISLLTLVALLAYYVPARRATNVDPLIALRAELARCLSRYLMLPA